MTLSNCTFTRVGSANDGGYVMCGNLHGQATSALLLRHRRPRRLGLQRLDDAQASGPPVRLLRAADARVRRRPVRAARRVRRHQGGNRRRRVCSTRITNQIARNGDAGKKLIVKIDVEGAEWDSLLDDAGRRCSSGFDQLAMELHGTNERAFIDVVQKLKRTLPPGSRTLQQLGVLARRCRRSRRRPIRCCSSTSGWASLGPPPAGRPTARDFDAPDNPAGPDCQLPSSTP